MSYPRRPKVILDIKEYFRVKNRERREKAKRAGLCVQCVNDPSEPNRTRCATCLAIERNRHQKAA